MITVIKYYYRPQKAISKIVCLTADDYNRFYKTVENSNGLYTILEIKRINKDGEKK